jgi:tRNA-2-methylthio-N6-dimethylallyladenosine synthase
MELVKKAEFEAMFTFIYSKRPGTAANKLPDTISREAKQRRFDKLLELQNRISEKKHTDYIGKTITVLVDETLSDDNYPLRARTNGGRLVHIKGDPEAFGSIINIKVTHCSTWALFGETI